MATEDEVWKLTTMAQKAVKRTPPLLGEAKPEMTKAEKPSYSPGSGSEFKPESRGRSHF